LNLAALAYAATHTKSTLSRFATLTSTFGANLLNPSLLASVRAATPVVNNPIPDQVGDPGVPFNLAFNWTDVFSDADGDTLGITARQSNGDPLPDWLTLNAHPVEVGSVATADLAIGSAVDPARQLLYVGVNGAGMSVINVSDPTQPQLIRTFNTPSYGQKPAILSDDVTLLTDHTNGLVSINTSTPAIPTTIDTYPTGGVFAYDIELSPDRTTAYVGQYWGGFKIFDVTDPTNLRLLSERPTVGTIVFHTHLVGNTLYVPADNIHVFDIRNTSAPIELASHSQLPSAVDIAVKGNLAYALDYTTGLHIYRMNNATHWSELGGYHATPGAVSGAGYLDLDVVGDTAFIVDDGALLMVDASNTSAPRLMGSHGPAGYRRLTMNGQYAYASDTYGQSLDVINVAPHSLSGTPPSNVSAFYSVDVITTDSDGNTVTDRVNINIGNAPVPTTGTTAAPVTTGNSAPPASTTGPGLFPTTTTASSTPSGNAVSASAASGALLLPILLGVGGVGGGVACLLLLATVGVIALRRRQHDASNNPSSSEASDSRAVSLPSGEDPNDISMHTTYASSPSTESQPPKREQTPMTEDYANVRTAAAGNGGGGDISQHTLYASSPVAQPPEREQTPMTEDYANVRAATGGNGGGGDISQHTLYASSPVAQPPEREQTPMGEDYANVRTATAGNGGGGNISQHTLYASSPVAQPAEREETPMGEDYANVRAATAGSNTA